MNARTWTDFALVFLGGGLGSAARWATNAVVAARFGTELTWPWTTFGINIAGSFLIGLVAGLATNGSITPTVRLFLAIGVMGGFTTFSSFSFELLTAVEGGRSGIALAYAASSVVLGLAGAFAGVSLARLVR